MRTYEEDGQVSMFGADLVCSKMYPDFYPQTTAKTSEPSWKKLQGSQTRPFLFLDLTEGSGQAREPLSVTDFLLCGECTTLDFGESHNGGEDSLFSPTSMAYLPLRSCLSAILEKNPDPKYNLSPKACQGILNRAERRGKKLPEALRIALERQARLPSETTTTDESLPMNPSRSTLVGGVIDSQTSSKSESEDGALNPWDSQSARVYSGSGTWHSLNANEGGGQSRDAVLIDESRAGGGTSMNPPTYCYNEVQVTSPINASNPKAGDPAPTLNCDAGRMILCNGDFPVALEANSGQSANHAGPGVMAFKLGNGADSRSIGLEVEVAPTLNSESGGNKPAVLTVNKDEQTKN